ncbi:4529_t:CDS:2, partial [Diversispora eburnea]
MVSSTLNENSTSKHLNIGVDITEKKPRHTPNNAVEPLIVTSAVVNLTVEEKNSINIIENKNISEGGVNGIKVNNTSNNKSPRRNRSDPSFTENRQLSSEEKKSVSFPANIKKPLSTGKPKRSMSAFPASNENDSQAETPGKSQKKRQLKRRNTYNAEMMVEELVLSEETQKWAENVKRRLSRRVKGKDNTEEDPIIGTRIGVDHVNYVLMYNMLTGIRVGRELNEADFRAAHKLAFD